MSSASVKATDSKRSILDEVAHLRRGVYLARLEGLASLADTAHTFLNEVAENEPLSESDDLGEAIRGTPETIRVAAQSARSNIADIPSRVIDKFHAEFHASRSSKGKTKQKTE